MKSRHTATVAFLGWYLMVPLYSNVQMVVAQVTRDSGDVTRLRQDDVDKATAEAVIARNKWLLKISHVIDVVPTGTFDAHDNYSGSAVAVVVDKARNVSDVERKVPSTLNGLLVVVMSLELTPGAVDLSAN
jgi:hypothetical protein